MMDRGQIADVGDAAARVAAAGNGCWIDGAALSGASIPSGAREPDIEQDLSNLGVGFAVNFKAPLHVTLRWELQKL